MQWTFGFYKRQGILTSWVTVSFSRSTLLHVVSWLGGRLVGRSVGQSDHLSRTWMFVHTSVLLLLRGEMVTVIWLQCCQLLSSQSKRGAWSWPAQCHLRPSDGGCLCSSCRWRRKQWPSAVCYEYHYCCFIKCFRRQVCSSGLHLYHAIVYHQVLSTVKSPEMKHSWMENA